MNKQQRFETLKNEIWQNYFSTNKAQKAISLDISEIDDSEFSLDELIIWDIGNNKVKVVSARLIELVKDRIPKSKNVEIYKNHALVLVTNAYATQAEILDYANAIIKIVKKVFNIELQIEPTLVE